MAIYDKDNVERFRGTAGKYDTSTPDGRRQALFEFAGDINVRAGVRLSQAPQDVIDSIFENTQREMQQHCPQVGALTLAEYIVDLPDVHDVPFSVNVHDEYGRIPKRRVVQAISDVDAVRNPIYGRFRRKEIARWILGGLSSCKGGLEAHAVKAGSLENIAAQLVEKRFMTQEDAVKKARELLDFYESAKATQN